MTDYIFTTEVTGSVAYCDTVVLDQAYFLALFDRTFPADYLAPLKAYPNSGYELFKGYAEIGARMATAVRNLECGSFVIFAEDAAIAIVDVVFARPDVSTGAFTIKAGTVVKTAVGGREFVLPLDVSFGALDLTVTASAVAVATGYEWNVLGERTTAGGQLLAGEIDTVVTLLMDPPYADPRVTVSQQADATGGVAPILDGLGHDRGVDRASGEEADAYRVRVRSLPDTISPAAVRRAVTKALAPFGIAFDFIETWMITYQTCWDAPSPNSGTPTYQAVPPTNPLYDNTLFCYDDPRDEWPLRNVWLDEREYRGAFIIVVNLATLNDLGLAYDDPGMMPTDFRDPLTGWGRGTSAFDITSADDPTLVYSCAYDGFDFLYSPAMFGLYKLLQRIKAAGVAAILERRRL